MNDPKIAEQIWIACKRDKLFWLNTFCWIEEPRERGHSTKVIPFLTWPVQDWVVESWDPFLGKKDLLSVKPRAFGMTWLFLAFGVLHPWLFSDDRLHIGLASRDDDAVDNRDDPDSLLPKLDLLLEYMPPFLYDPSRAKRVTGKLINYETGSTIIGYAATGDLGRGGRKWLWFKDEFGAFAGNAWNALASTQFTTDCRAIVSTIPEDPTAAFNEIALDPKRPMIRLQPNWYDVPPYRKGLYRSRDGVTELIDLTYQHEEGYKFINDGLLRSTWYDDQEARSGGSRQVMAREVDCSFIDGASRAFPDALIRKLHDKSDVPTARGRIGFDPEDFSATWYAEGNGPLWLWCDLIDGKPSTKDAYAIGVDISAGAGASNSVISVFSRSTGKQVAEYVSAYDDPSRWAAIAVAMGRWFCGDEPEAYLTFEANGPVGTIFRDAIKRIGYVNLHRRTIVDEKVERRTKKLGYHTPPAGPGAVLSALLTACERGKATVLSTQCVTDFGEYVWVKGRLSHGSSAGNDNESEGKDTHGDRAVAAALAWIGCQARPRKTIEEQVKAEGPAWHSVEWWELEFARRGTEVGDDVFNFS